MHLFHVLAFEDIFGDLAWIGACLLRNQVAKQYFSLVWLTMKIKGNSNRAILILFLLVPSIKQESQCYLLFGIKLILVLRFIEALLDGFEDILDITIVAAAFVE